MQNVAEFVASIYLGDRGLKTIEIDCWRRTVSFTINCISRLREGTSEWNYYSERDIEDGKIVLTGVENIHFNPSGPLPDDFINDFKVLPFVDHLSENEPPRYIFTLNVSSGRPDGRSSEVIIEVIASAIHLLAPTDPDKKITD